MMLWNILRRMGYRAILTASLCAAASAGGGCYQGYDQKNIVVQTGPSFDNLNKDGVAGPRDVVLVSERVGDKLVPIEATVEQDAPASLACLNGHFGDVYGVEVSPSPPWWRYTRGRWTFQRTNKTGIIAGGTTMIIIGYTKNGVAEEIVALLHDPAEVSKLTVFAYDTYNAESFECDVHKADEKYVVVDGLGKVSTPMTVDSWPELRGAVDCIVAYVESLQIAPVFAQ